MHFRTSVYVKDGYYFKDDDKRLSQSDWSHIVVNFNVDQFRGKKFYSFSTFVNGVQILTDSTRYKQDTTEGKGRMVIGRAFTEVDSLYTSMDVDQMVMFNRV